MKKINVCLLSLLSIGLVTSCNDAFEDNLEDVRAGKPILTLDRVQANAIEGSPITFTLNVNTPSSKAIDYKIELSDNGTTASFRDFTVSSGGVDIDETTTDQGGFPQGRIGYLLKVPAQASSVTFTVNPTIDLLKEGTEKLNLRLVGALNGLGLVNPSTEIISVNISDYVSNDVGVGLTWDRSANTFGTIIPITYIGRDNASHDTDGYDYDLYILDSTGTPLNFDGATGNHPELVTLLASDPDGVYDVYFELYTGNAVQTTAFNLTRPRVPFASKVDVTISKYGVFSTMFSVPISTDDTFAGTVAQITKTGNNYVVTDFTTGAVLASGKLAESNGVKPNFKRIK